MEVGDRLEAEGSTLGGTHDLVDSQVIRRRVQAGVQHWQQVSDLPVHLLPVQVHAAMLAAIGAYGNSYKAGVTRGHQGVQGNLRDWTQAVLYSLPVEGWLSMDLEAVVGGPFADWAICGVAEVRSRS